MESLTFIVGMSLLIGIACGVLLALIVASIFVEEPGTWG